MKRLALFLSCFLYLSASAVAADIIGSKKVSFRGKREFYRKIPEEIILEVEKDMNQSSVAVELLRARLVSGKSAEEIVEEFLKMKGKKFLWGPHLSPAMLVTIAQYSGESLEDTYFSFEEIHNEVGRLGAYLRTVSFMNAMVLSGKDIDEVLAIYEEISSKKWYWNSRYALVILTDTVIQTGEDADLVFSRFEEISQKRGFFTSSSTAAELTRASILHQKSSDEILLLFSLMNEKKKWSADLIPAMLLALLLDTNKGLEELYVEYQSLRELLRAKNKTL